MLQCERHKTTRDTDLNAIRTQLSLPSFGGQCALYTFNLKPNKAKKQFPNVGDEKVIGLCNIKRLS